MPQEQPLGVKTGIEDKTDLEYIIMMLEALIESDPQLTLPDKSEARNRAKTKRGPPEEPGPPE